MDWTVLNHTVILDISEIRAADEPGGHGHLGSVLKQQLCGRRGLGDRDRLELEHPLHEGPDQLNDTLRIQFQVTHLRLPGAELVQVS